jgi:hypothetical protein
MFANNEDEYGIGRVDISNDKCMQLECIWCLSSESATIPILVQEAEFLIAMHERNS